MNDGPWDGQILSLKEPIMSTTKAAIGLDEKTLVNRLALKFLNKKRNYSGILPQRHQDTKIIELFFMIAFLMSLRRTLKLMRKLRYSIYIHLPRLPSVVNRDVVKKLRNLFDQFITISGCNGLSPLNIITYAWNADSRMPCQIREGHTQFPDSPKAKKTRASRGQGHFTLVCILWPPLTGKQLSGLPLLCIRLFPFQTIWYCLKELLFQDNIWKEVNDTPG